MNTHLLPALLLPLLTLAPAGAPADPPEGPGIAVEEVAAGGALAEAGVKPGDLLVSWEQGDDRGELRTVFDWLWLGIERAPRGTVHLHGERQGAAISFTASPGEWEARVRPRLAAGAEASDAEGRRRIEAGDLAGGVARWDELGRATPELQGWLFFQAGEALSAAGQIPKAQAAFEAALVAAPDVRARVAILEALSGCQELRSAMDPAEASLRSAVETGEAAWGESLRLAHSLSLLGNLLRQRNRPDESDRTLTRALEIQQRLAPESLELADTLNRLAGTAWVRGDLDGMTTQARRALDIEERLAPDSPAMSRTLNNLGVALTARGRLEEAAAALERALAIQQRRHPGSRAVALALGNLGMLARSRGDLAAAEETFRRALAIWEKVAPEGLGVAPVLNNLAAIARERGELDAAEALFERALAIWTKTAPEGLGVAGGNDSLGLVAQARGDLETAWTYHSRALSIIERLGPGGIDHATVLKSLGAVAEARGDLPLAREFDLRAAAILARLAAGSISEAQALRQLGHLERRLGRIDEAAAALSRAVAALETHVGALGGSRELRAEYRARHAEIYREAIELEVERGRQAEAFHLVERSRARVLLALLAERDLAFTADLPAAVERSRRDNAAHYDRALRELLAWTEKAGEPAREALQRELAGLRRERETIASEVQKAAPRLAALEEPQPLDLEAARQVLDPGTLALSYSVGKETTTLFALTREGALRVETLPIGEEALRREVASFLARVRSQEKPAADLYRALIAPVAELVAQSERLLILPDGPLHRLPFGALRRDDGRYLIEEKPVHTALSLTVYGALRAFRAAPVRPLELVAFADPLVAPAPAARGLGPGLRSFDWSRLPFSRREAEEIAGSYRASRLYLGEEATEERAKAVHGARILHFATHGYTDDRTPLDSALVLTMPESPKPGEENGLLQVWEIFEGVRLDADLVVLSACESALGREQSGEGLIGLTRAFQFAGARSVVASLWAVADQVTAELMVRFHRHLAAGLDKDQALRRAQLELLHQPVEIETGGGRTSELDASAPFFWAAFELFGDWR